MKSKSIIFTILLVSIFIFVPSEVNAYDYLNEANRIMQNQNMYTEANRMTSLEVNRYKDKSLKEMFETNFIGLSKNQQQEISDLANTILKGKGSTMTDMEKLKAFHDWIIDHYYYYAKPYTLDSFKSLGANACDNPYYILKYEYEKYGKVRARCNGFSSMFIALARSQGIPARGVTGFYYQPAKIEPVNWTGTVRSNSHYWAQAYVNGRWIMVDPNSDCFRWYEDDSSNPYKFNQSRIDLYSNIYFDVGVKRLSQSHIAFQYRAGSKGKEFMSDPTEIFKLRTFLNKKWNNKTNGKRVTSNYNQSKPSTWFSIYDQNSQTDGYGKLRKLYWPKYRTISGNLDLSGFTSLQNLNITNNNLTKLYLYNCPSLSTVTVYRNNLKTIIITDSRNLKLLSATSNSLTYVKYNFNNIRVGFIKTTSGGTVSVRYEIKNNKYIHSMTAKNNKGYKFRGWYRDNKRVSTSKTLTISKTTSFTYTAKFYRSSK